MYRQVIYEDVQVIQQERYGPNRTSLGGAFWSAWINLAKGPVSMMFGTNRHLGHAQHYVKIFIMMNSITLS